MTVSSTTRTVSFIGSGSASTFAFAFKVFGAPDLLVTSLNMATGISTTLALTTDYSASLNANQDVSPGGSVTLSAGPLATGFTLTITSAIPNTQPTEFLNAGGFYPEVLTQSLDRLTILIQQLQDSVAAVSPFSITPIVPAGTIDGVGTTGNRVFTLPTAPKFPAAAQLVLNKAILSNGTDYNISATTLTYTTPLPPQEGDTHEIFYS